MVKQNYNKLKIFSLVCVVLRIIYYFRVIHYKKNLYAPSLQVIKCMVYAVIQGINFKPIYTLSAKAGPKLKHIYIARKIMEVISA